SRNLAAEENARARVEIDADASPPRFGAVRIVVELIESGDLCGLDRLTRHQRALHGLEAGHAQFGIRRELQLKPYLRIPAGRVELALLVGHIIVAHADGPRGRLRQRDIEVSVAVALSAIEISARPRNDESGERDQLHGGIFADLVVANTEDGTAEPALD